MTYLYNPRRASSAELDRTFVARTELLKELLDQLRTQAHARSLQHVLIVGPRGSGKTHLTTLLARRIREGELNQFWRPIQLAEEHWEVSTVRELVLAAFEMLEAEAKAGQPLDDPASLPDHLRPATAIQALKQTANPQQGAELGIALLNELARRTGRKNLLILENVDEILDAQFDDDFGLKQLRSELMTGPHTLLIATSPGRVTGLEEHDYPLFGLFRVHALPDFSLADLEDLLRKRSQLESESDPQSPATEFRQRLVAEPHRIRALLFLTGGNPRMALMLYKVLVQGDVRRAGEELDRLLDELTTYFQGRLKELPPQEKKIVVALAKSGRAMRPSEIAAEIGLRPQQMSTLISRLIDRGHLRLAPQREGKGRYYVLREILFRYWHHWRAQEREFLLFVEFLAAWFRREELEQWLAGSAARPQQDAWPPLLQQAIARQPAIVDRLSLNQHEMSSITTDGISLSLDELSIDPLIQRFLHQYPLPPDSPGERLFQADRAGDWGTSDPLAVTVAAALRDGTIGADQELGTLTRVLVHGWGDGPLSAAQAIQRRRSPDTEADYLYACTLARSNRHTEAAAEFARLENAFAADEDPIGDACCWYRLGVSQMFCNDLDGCEASLLKAKDTFSASGHKLGEANCRKSLGDLQLRVGDLEGANAFYAAALPIYREIRARLGEANCLKSLGDLLLRVSDVDGARTAYAVALPIYREIRDRLGEANCLKSLADLRLRVSDLDDARTAYADALPIYREIRYRLGEAHCLRSLGDLLLCVSDLEGARTAYAAALPIYREIRDPFGEANCLKSLGDLRLRVSDLEGSRTAYGDALSICREIRYRLGEANCLKSLGDLLLRVPDLEGARTAYADALPIYREIRHRLGEANTLKSMATLELQVGEADLALGLLRQSREISTEIHDEMGLMGSEGYAGNALMSLRRPAEAVMAYESALAHGRNAQDVHGQALALARQFAALNAIGQGASALAALFLCRPLGERACLGWDERIRRAFDAASKQIGEEPFRALMAELEADAEAVRQRGVQAAAAMVSLEQRISAHRQELDELTRLVQTMQSDAPSAGQLTVAQQIVVRLFERDDLQDIAAGLIQGGLLQLLRAGRPADALAWIERLDGWLPAAKRGLFAPLGIAARHLRGEPADARILDQQAPEVRESVEMILREAREERAGTEAV